MWGILWPAMSRGLLDGGTAQREVPRRALMMHDRTNALIHLRTETHACCDARNADARLSAIGCDPVR